MNSLQTTPAWKQVEDVVREIPGWSPLDQLYTLFTMAFMSAGTPGDIIEVGSWCGRSSCALGLVARLTGGTTVHCIDLFPAKNDWYENDDGTWSFSVSFGGKTYGGYQDQRVWAEPYKRDIVPVYGRHEGLVEFFKESIRRAGLESVIRAHRGTVGTFAAAAPAEMRCRLAFLDGDHSYGGLSEDIRTIERFLVPGGWICFDDAFTQYEGVDRAIREHVIESGRYENCQQLTRKFFVARRRS